MLVNSLINTDPIPHGPYSDVVVLVDVLRTGTVAPLLLDRGASAVSLSPSIKRARSEARPGVRLVGERSGVPLEGFNHGNSPIELSQVEIAGLEAVLVSENAPLVMAEVETAKHVLLASLYNAAAAARLAAASSQGRVDIVCCGFRGTPDLDDLLAAGVIAAELGPDIEAGGFTRLALSLVRSFPDPLEALWQSTCGTYLRSLGQERDLAFCAGVSVSESVPRLDTIVAGGDGPIYRFTAATR